MRLRTLFSWYWQSVRLYFKVEASNENDWNCSISIENYGGGENFLKWDLQQSGFDQIEIATWNFAKEESTDFLESSLENLRFILTFLEIDLARGWKENDQIANFLQNLRILKSFRNLQTQIMIDDKQV